MVNAQARPWNIKARIADNCLPRRGVECRICGDSCPVSAIRFSPRLAMIRGGGPYRFLHGLRRLPGALPGQCNPYYLMLPTKRF